MPNVIQNAGGAGSRPGAAGAAGAAGSTFGGRSRCRRGCCCGRSLLPVRPEVPRGRLPQPKAPRGRPAATPPLLLHPQPFLRSETPPISCTPDVSTSVGAVVQSQITKTKNAAASAGRRAMNRCWSRVFIGTSAFRFPLIAPISPTMTLLVFFGDHLRELGQLHMLLLCGEGRGDAGLELRGEDHVAEIEGGQHDAGQKRPGIELDDRDARGRAIKDQEDRGRDQDAEGSPRAHDARREPDAVTGLEHGWKGEQAHQRHAPPR